MQYPFHFLLPFRSIRRSGSGGDSEGPRYTTELRKVRIFFSKAARAEKVRRNVIWPALVNLNLRLTPFLSLRPYYAFLLHLQNLLLISSRSLRPPICQFQSSFNMPFFFYSQFGTTFFSLLPTPSNALHLPTLLTSRRDHQFHYYPITTQQIYDFLNDLGKKMIR